MFVLICATLLFSVRRISAATDGSVTWCFNEYCITVSKGEIAAEAGLCVVIPCSFTTASGFTPKHLVWYKCEPSNQKCGDSNMIFNSDKSSEDVQAGFMGRVSLLQPLVGLKNCSIIINDLTESDSGSYQLRVNGLNYWKADGLTFNHKVTISVKGLTQKPTVGIPPLAEGQQTTLSCTAPGLCSGSDPEITWTWRGAGEKDSPITGSITAVKTEHLTSVTGRRSSTLTFNRSAEHHGTDVTCKVSFTNNITTEETVTLDLTYVKDLNISRNTSVKEGEPLNLTCGVESFPPSLITWTRSPETHTQNQTDTHWHNNTFTQRASGMSTFYVLNVTPEYSGRYICTAKHLDRTLEQYVDVNVIYVRSPVITGSTTALEGGALNLTCAVESFPPSRVTWAASGTTRRRGLDADRQNGTGSAASLVIPDVAAEDSGRYTCTAEHPDGTVTAYADVTVTWPPRFSNSSRCDVRSEVVTCVCVSEGLPLPSISWPLLKNHSEYSVVTTVSGHAVNSTATLTLRDHVGTSVQCVSSNDHGEARGNLRVQQTTWDTEDLHGPCAELPWMVIAVISLIVNIICMVLSMFLWNTRKKVTPNQEDRTYMSLQKSDQSSEYDVIARPLN